MAANYFIINLRFFPPLPPLSFFGSGLAAQAVSLGDEVMAVTDAHSFDGLNMTKEFERKSLRKSALTSDPTPEPHAAQPKDVHFYFRSKTPTSACPKGRSTIVTMRCDVDDKSLKGNRESWPRSPADE